MIDICNEIPDFSIPRKKIKVHHLNEANDSILEFASLIIGVS